MASIPVARLARRDADSNCGSRESVTLELPEVHRHPFLRQFTLVIVPTPRVQVEGHIVRCNLSREAAAWHEGLVKRDGDRRPCWPRSLGVEYGDDRPFHRSLATGSRSAGWCKTTGRGTTMCVPRYGLLERTGTRPWHCATWPKFEVRLEHLPNPFFAEPGRVRRTQTRAQRAPRAIAVASLTACR